MTIRVVIRGLPSDIGLDEIKTYLKNRGFETNLVRHFSTKEKPMPMCMAILKKTSAASKIYNITNLFYISIKAKYYFELNPPNINIPTFLTWLM